MQNPTIGFVCPLYEELQAVIATFDEELPSKDIEDTEYRYGRIGKRTAVAVQFLYGEKGPTFASLYGSQLLQHHPQLKDKDSFCFLVGIAGGIWTSHSDVRLGDVVIATKVHDWKSGKETAAGFEPTTFPENVSVSTRRKLPSFLHHKELLPAQLATQVARMQEVHNEESWKRPSDEDDHLYQNDYTHVGYGLCQGVCDPQRLLHRPNRPDNFPLVHDGLIASGPVVLKDTRSRPHLLRTNTLAVEMEACGIPKNFIIVRGISDYADSHKNDAWRYYAAATAAACTRLMIEEFTRPRRSSTPSGAGSGIIWKPVDRPQTPTPPAELTASIQPPKSPRPQEQFLDMSSFDSTIRFEVRSLIVRLCDRRTSKPKTKEHILESCLLYYDIGKDKRIERFKHRLRVYQHQNDEWYCFWLPLIGLHVSQYDGANNIIYLTFSNCKRQMKETGWPAGFEQEDSLSTHLQIQLDICMKDKDHWFKLRNTLLHRTEHTLFSYHSREHNADRRSAVRSGYIETENGVVDACFIWPYYLLDQLRGMADEPMGLERIFVRTRSIWFDFFLQRTLSSDGRDDCVKLRLQNLQRPMQRLPQIVDVEQWLQLESHKLAETNPMQNSITYKEWTPLDIITDVQNVVQVMNIVISPMAGWTARAWFEVHLSIVGLTVETRWRARSGAQACLTIWESEDGNENTMLLFRGAQGSETAYIAVTLPQASVTYARKEEATNQKATSAACTLNHVAVRPGDRLTFQKTERCFTPEFHMQYSDEKTRSCTIEFASWDEVNRFEAIISTVLDI